MDTNLNNQNGNGGEIVPGEKNDNGKEFPPDKKDSSAKEFLSDRGDGSGRELLPDKKDDNGGRKILPGEKNNNDEETISNEKDLNSGETIPDKRSGKNLFSTSLATVLIILALAIISVVSYLPIRNIYFPVGDNVKNHIESSGINSMAYNIARLTRSLQRYVNQRNDWSDDRYINVESIKYKIYPLGEGGDSEQAPGDGISADKKGTDAERAPEDGKTAKTAKDEISEKIPTEPEGDRTDDEKETVGETGEGLTVQRRPLTNMPYISDAELQTEMDNSLLYIKMSFDENGYPTVDVVLGDELRNKGTRFDKGLIIDYLKAEQAKEAEQYANLEAIYIIPRNFESHNDVLTLGMKENYVFPDYSVLILVIGAISILILIIAAFAIPYSLQNKIAICRGFNKMPLELKFAAWILLIGLLGINVAVFDSHRYGYVNPLTRIIYDVNPYFYIIGIPITFILYLLIYLNTVYIKYLYHTGFRKGLIDSSFIGKALLFLAGGIREISKRLMTVDLREDNQRRLIGIAVMNFLVIVILGSGGFLGIVLAVIYSIVVFKYILGLIESASELNLASEQVSAGNFDIKVGEDMGILTPMAKNLNNIKQGFSVAVDKKIRSERMKSELISNVSHDLKTPLTSIITYVDLLKNGDVEPNTQKEYIDVIDKKSQRLKILIEDLFEASKATSGNIDFNLEDIDVVALLRQTLGELEEKINESDLQFRINAPENKVMCNLDGRRTYRVFANIISNILKYSMENSRVYIDIIESEHEVSFTFKNISACEMNFDPSDITERFARGDESRSTDGAGLGLSIAKSLVELQGGTLDITIDGDLFKLVVTFSKA